MQSMEEIYQQYSNTIYQYLLCLTGNSQMAEDLTQETFVIALKKIHQFRGESKVSTWLCQIAKHLWYKELKKMKKKQTEELTENIATLPVTEDLIVEKETKLQWFKKMQQLDEMARQVVYLRTMGDLNFIEIAEILRKTPNWARVTFFRAKQKMRGIKENGKENRM